MRSLVYILFSFISPHMNCNFQAIFHLICNWFSRRKYIDWLSYLGHIWYENLYSLDFTNAFEFTKN